MGKTRIILEYGTLVRIIPHKKSDICIHCGGASTLEDQPKYIGRIGSVYGSSTCLYGVKIDGRQVVMCRTMVTTELEYKTKIGDFDIEIHHKKVTLHHVHEGEADGE